MKMKKRKSVILIGTLPPPLDGQSVAFKVLIDYYKTNTINCKIINISSRKIRNKSNSSSQVFRYYDYMFVLLKLFYSLIAGYRLLYLQIAQSKRGFVRDKWIIKIGSFFNCKIIAHLHGGNYNGFYNSLDLSTQEEVKICLRTIDAMIILSENLRGMFDFEPTLKDKLYVVSNGAGQKNVMPERKNSITKGINILYLSNLVETKGYLEVLEAISILVNQYKLPVKANFCGRFSVDNDRSQFNTVEEAKLHFFNKIAEYQLKDIVAYKGVVEGVEKQQLLNDAHFFVLPTRYINEGQPISIIEAMRSGCVVVASNYRAIPEMIQHNYNGYLLKNADHQEIADIINYDYHHPEEYDQISINAFNTYNEKYTEMIHCKNILQLIDLVVKK